MLNKTIIHSSIQFYEAILPLLLQNEVESLSTQLEESEIKAGHAGKESSSLVAQLAEVQVRSE